MRNRIFSHTGILDIEQSILLDRDLLWRRFDCEEKAIAAGYEVVHFVDDMALRRYYEFDCHDRPAVSRIMVIDRGDLYIPLDIARRFQIIELSLQQIFPMLDSEALSQLPGLDFDHLAFVADRLPLKKLNRQENFMTS